MYTPAPGSPWEKRSGEFPQDCFCFTLQSNAEILLSSPPNRQKKTIMRKYDNIIDWFQCFPRLVVLHFLHHDHTKRGINVWYLVFPSTREIFLPSFFCTLMLWSLWRSWNSFLRCWNLLPSKSCIIWWRGCRNNLFLWRLVVEVIVLVIVIEVIV